MIDEIGHGDTQEADSVFVDSISWKNMASRTIDPLSLSCWLRHVIRLVRVVKFHSALLRPRSFLACRVFPAIGLPYWTDWQFLLKYHLQHRGACGRSALFRSTCGCDAFNRAMWMPRAYERDHSQSAQIDQSRSSPGWLKDPRQYRHPCQALHCLLSYPVKFGNVHLAQEILGILRQTTVSHEFLVVTAILPKTYYKRHLLKLWDAALPR